MESQPRYRFSLTFLLLWPTCFCVSLSLMAWFWVAPQTAFVGYLGFFASLGCLFSPNDRRAGVLVGLFVGLVWFVAIFWPALAIGFFTTF